MTEQELDHYAKAAYEIGKVAMATTPYDKLPPQTKRCWRDIAGAVLSAPTYVAQVERGAK